MSKSYPYLAIARKYDLPYEVVLLYAEWWMQYEAPEDCRYWVRWAFRRVVDWYKQNDPGADFDHDVRAAVNEFRRIQKEGWD